eukprot:1364422-Amorphochlora_amoeboformis.AAC.1
MHSASAVGNPQAVHLESNFSNMLEPSREFSNCRDISGSPVLPGTTQHCPILPGTTGKVISEQSRGSLAISGVTITTLSQSTKTYVSRQV